MDISQLTEFFGWMSVINIGLFLFSVIMMAALKKTVGKLHSKLFAVEEQDLYGIYLTVLGQYKILVIVFNIVPYIALTAIG